VDVETGFQRMPVIGATLQRFGAQRHQRMHAEQGGHLAIAGFLALANPAFIFFYSFSLAVAVRHLVTEAAAQPHIPECPFNLVKTAVNAGRGSMVVDNRGTSSPGRVHYGQ